ncbi:MAG: hypothetical protein EA401_10685, partial [Planctomycetota bacterium]
MPDSRIAAPIESFWFGNIRSFRGIHHVPLKPLTLIIGANSQGKTTILQALAMLLQSLGQDCPDDDHAFISMGSVVKAGLYNDLVPNSDPRLHPVLGVSSKGVAARWSFRNAYDEAGGDDNVLRLEHLSVRGVFLADRIGYGVRVSSQIGKQVLRRLVAMWSGGGDVDNWSWLLDQELPSRSQVDEALEEILVSPEGDLERLIRRTIKRYKTQNVE